MALLPNAAYLKAKIFKYLQRNDNIIGNARLSVMCLEENQD